MGISPLVNTTLLGFKLNVTHLLIVIIALAPWVAVAHGADDAPLPGPIPAKVLRVVDGDTVQVRARIWLSQDVETSVRIAGIDTPEKRGKCDTERHAAERAEAFTAGKLAVDDWVTLHDVIADKYGKRVVARVTSVRGEDMGAQLVSHGLARPYGGRAKQPWCP